MKNLPRRQIIILVIMAVVICYGLYDFISSKSKKTDMDNPALKSADLSAFVNDFTAGIAKGLPSKMDLYIVSRAETKWAGNPFNDTRLYTSWKMTKEPAAQAAAVRKDVFTYTGYMEAGAKKIAIINSMEYGAGEALDIQGYAVKAIYPSRVVILNKKENKTIIVPMQE